MVHLRTNLHESFQQTVLRIFFFKVLFSILHNGSRIFLYRKTEFRLVFDRRVLEWKSFAASGLKLTDCLSIICQILRNWQIAALYINKFSAE